LKTKGVTSSTGFILKHSRFQVYLSKTIAEIQGSLTKHPGKIVSLDNLHITLSAKNQVSTPILVKLTNEICGIIRMLVYPVKGLPINPAKLLNFAK
jgi:hypothetical protein